jgi:chromosome segregation ATPase
MPEDEALRRAYEAQARHLAAERARVAEQIEDLERELARAREVEASLRSELVAHRAEIDRLEAEKAHLKHLYEGVVQMRAVRWSAAVRRAVRGR